MAAFSSSLDILGFEEMPRPNKDISWGSFRFEKIFRTLN